RHKAGAVATDDGGAAPESDGVFGMRGDPLLELRAGHVGGIEVGAARLGGVAQKGGVLVHPVVAAVVDLKKLVGVAAGRIGGLGQPVAQLDVVGGDLAPEDLV